MGFRSAAAQIICSAICWSLYSNKYNHTGVMMMNDEVRRQRRDRTCSGLKRRRYTTTRPFAMPTVYVATFCLLSSSFMCGTDSYNSAITFSSMGSRQSFRSDIIHRIISSSLSVSIADNGGNIYRKVESNIHSPSFEVTYSAIQRSKYELKDLLNRNLFDEGRLIILSMFQIYSDAVKSLYEGERKEISSLMDLSIQAFLVNAFATPIGHDHMRVLAGIDVMNLQISKKALATPYNTISRKFVVNAINAITSLPNEATNYSNQSNKQPSRLSYTTIAYRLLQRLISGVGVRGKPTYMISERDFHQVLQAHCKIGHMISAERIARLQTVTIPPISLVTFSILLKGYGQKKDLRSVEYTIERTKICCPTLDTIMINTIIDAYINCNAMKQAENFFAQIRVGNMPINRRTYNTYMKGLAKQGELLKAQSLALEMKERKLWDSVTTNTLVHASIVAGNVTYAEEILEKETMRSEKYKYQHPNVEAYTELLDTYSKMNELERSLSVLQTMQRRNVEPNEVTYMCLMGGLGRNHRIDLAQKIISYMESKGQRPTTKIYNALFSGLFNESATDAIDCRVDDGLKLLFDLQRTNALPNSVTVSIFVDALGRCTAPRVVEAQMLVDEFTRCGYVSSRDHRVLTSLLRVYGRVGNFPGVVTTFQKIDNPDCMAVNVYLDACCRCGREKSAVDAFELYFRNGKKASVRPDVVSYAILIGSILKSSTVESLRKARLLYADMKSSHNISPDNGLVDVILKSSIRIGSARQLTKQHVLLIAEVLQDAEYLQWDDSQLNRRRRAIRASILESFGDTLRLNDPILDLVPSSYADDDLFDRKGWNQVHSGFPLWGSTATRQEADSRTKNKDQFLKSHGWNDVDSTFRLI